MGGAPSTPLSPEQLLRSFSMFLPPWREVNWENRDGALQHVRKYQPETDGQQLRVLLYGPVGAGKSSFINSVQSVLHGRMYTHALADNISHDSFTRKYLTYKIKKGGCGSCYPFVFSDVMGLDPSGGVLVDDITLALKGHVRDGYQFNPERKLSRADPFYNKDPTLNDKVHVLVCVVPATSVSDISEKVLQKIQAVGKEAGALGIPHLAVFTKIDETSNVTKEDLQYVYKDPIILLKMQRFGAAVGIPVSSIFAVKNYHEEIDLNRDVDLLILDALKPIISAANGCISRMKE